MRVLNVLFEDRYGGPQKMVIDVGSRLLSQEVKTILLLPTGEGNTSLIAKANGLHCVRTSFNRTPKPRDIYKVLRWIMLLPKDVYLISKVIKDKRIDIVHVNGAFFLAPALAAKISRRPIVWTLHETIMPSNLARVFGIFVRWMANEVVVVAEAVARHYKVDDHSHSVVYAPVDIERITPKNPIDEQIPRHVGLIANWNPIKGLEVFVEAASIVKSQVNDGVEFDIAGSRLESHANYAGKIEQLIYDRKIDHAMHCHGFVEDIPQFLHTLDILVLASWSEACPMAVLEAMAAGIPVVATDVGGIRELLKPDSNNRAGYVVSPGDSAQMADRVLDLLNNSKLRHEMGNNGRIAAEQWFSLEACTTSHLKMYRHLMVEHK